MDTQSVIRSLVREVQDVAAEHPERRVLSFRVRVGERSGIAPEMLTRAYLNAVRHTPLCDSALIVEQVAPEATCEQCGNRFPLPQAVSQCNRCGSLRLALRGGDELSLDSVLMED
jgi:hydrogenase nickel incorporation protein HypA/HybF